MHILHYIGCRMGRVCRRRFRVPSTDVTVAFVTELKENAENTENEQVKGLHANATQVKSSSAHCFP